MSNELEGGWLEALHGGILPVQQCRACQHFEMYPKFRCPNCLSDDLQYVAAKGEGLLHSFAVVRAGSPSDFVGEIPYAVGVVKLDEGVQVLGRLEPDPDGEWTSYQCDDRVSFVHHGANEARPDAMWFARAGAQTS